LDHAPSGEEEDAKDTRDERDKSEEPITEMSALNLASAKDPEDFRGWP
jgi:hypothetical protein